jgi:hypothetical protein
MSVMIGADYIAESGRWRYRMGALGSALHSLDRNVDLRTAVQNPDSAKELVDRWNGKERIRTALEQ